jgi:hypothetical protein
MGMVGKGRESTYASRVVVRRQDDRLVRLELPLPLSIVEELLRDRFVPLVAVTEEDLVPESGVVVDTFEHGSEVREELVRLAGEGVGGHLLCEVRKMAGESAN